MTLRRADHVECKWAIDEPPPPLPSLDPDLAYVVTTCGELTDRVVLTPEEYPDLAIIKREANAIAMLAHDTVLDAYRKRVQAIDVMKVGAPAALSLDMGCDARCECAAVGFTWTGGAGCLVASIVNPLYTKGCCRTATGVCASSSLLQCNFKANIRFSNNSCPFPIAGICLGSCTLSPPPNPTLTCNGIWIHSLNEYLDCGSLPGQVDFHACDSMGVSGTSITLNFSCIACSN